MKRRFLINLLLIIGIAAFVCITLIVVFNVATMTELWVTYAGLASLLIIFLCLNLKFRKYTETEEALTCIRRIKRAILKITPEKELNYVKQHSVHNQLTNAALLLEDVIANNEFHTLKDNFAELIKLKEMFKPAEGVKINLKKEEIAVCTASLDLFIEELKELV